MSLHHRVLASLYYPLRIARTLGGPLGLASPNRLRVLLYHDVAPASEERFAAHLRRLARRWTFVTPERFGAMVTGGEPIRGSNVLLTFDDGFASNRVVAERILNPMGIRAIFFAIADFVVLEDAREAREFISRRIEIGRPIEGMPPHLYNMRWNDLEALLEQGHTVGAHTRTHARLSRLDGQDELDREIVGSADTIQQRLGRRVEHFAYTFGDIESFSEAALATARRRFRFVYSGVRGDNCDVSPIVLRREAVTAEDSPSLTGAFVEGAADFRYAGARAQLDHWAQHTAPSPQPLVVRPTAGAQ